MPEMDCKIMLAADEKLKATHAYFTQNYFLTCEDYYHEAIAYMAEVLDCHEIREPCPTEHDVSGLNNLVPVIVASSEDQFANFRRNFDKWESFYDKFKSMIHDNQSLTNVERMYYCIRI